MKSWGLNPSAVRPPQAYICSSRAIGFRILGNEWKMKEQPLLGWNEKWFSCGAGVQHSGAKQGRQQSVLAIPIMLIECRPLSGAWTTFSRKPGNYLQNPILFLCCFFSPHAQHEIKGVWQQREIWFRGHSLLRRGGRGCRGPGLVRCMKPGLSPLPEQSRTDNTCRHRPFENKKIHGRDKLSRWYWVWSGKN